MPTKKSCFLLLPFLLDLELSKPFLDLKHTKPSGNYSNLFDQNPIRKRRAGDYFELAQQVTFAPLVYFTFLLHFFLSFCNFQKLLHKFISLTKSV